MKHCLLILWLICLHIQLSAATFHALLIADTAEPKVSRSAKVDSDSMRHALKVIAKQSKMHLKQTRLLGKRAKAKNIQRWLQHTHVSKDDVVLFYFTGHGFAASNPKTIWPDIHLRSKSENVSLNNIKKALLKKKARLTIVLSDSCNNYALTTRVPKAMPLVQKAAVSPNFVGCKKLFRKSKGLIIASGAVRGTSSWGGDYGGFFTQGFLLGLEKQAHSSHPSWKQVFTHAGRLIKHAQKPQYRLYLK